MPIAPEQEHPTLEKRIEEPSELVRLEEERRELAQFIEPVERERVKEPVRDDSGQVLLTPAQPQAQTATQVTQDQINEGRRHPITDAFRWFVEWCIRMKKKFLISN